MTDTFRLSRSTPAPAIPAGPAWQEGMADAQS